MGLWLPPRATLPVVAHYCLRLNQLCLLFAWCCSVVMLLTLAMCARVCVTVCVVWYARARVRARVRVCAHVCACVCACVCVVRCTAIATGEQRRAIAVESMNDAGMMKDTPHPVLLGPRESYIADLEIEHGLFALPSGDKIRWQLMR